MNDYTELKRLAESCKGWDNMISCWPDQEQDGDADINWIVGHVGEDGDKYPVLELNTVQYDAPDDAEKLARFYAGANPAAILALIAENERLSGECEGCPMSIAEELRIELDQFRHEVERYRQYGCGTCDGSGHLHRLDGEYFSACTSCGAYELEQAKRERDQLKAENERMRLALKSAEDAMWKAESNMDNEAADIRDLLAAMSKGEQA